MDDTLRMNPALLLAVGLAGGTLAAAPPPPAAPSPSEAPAVAALKAELLTDAHAVGAGSVSFYRAYAYGPTAEWKNLPGQRTVAIELDFAGYERAFDLDDIEIVDGDRRVMDRALPQALGQRRRLDRDGALQLDDLAEHDTEGDHVVQRRLFTAGHLQLVERAPLELEERAGAVDAAEQLRGALEVIDLVAEVVQPRHRSARLRISVVAATASTSAPP